MGYYSGQGKLYVAERRADGTPKGFVPMGNVPLLALDIAVDKFEHTESTSGNRAVDLSVVKKKTGTLKATVEESSALMLALFFWGESEDVAAGTGATTTVKAVLGKRVPLPYPKVSSVVVKNVGATTTFEFGTSATAAGSKNGYVDETYGVLHIFTAAEQTAKGATVSITDEQVLGITYNNAANASVEAFTRSSNERYLRFEGMNTIEGGGNVTVDVFRVSLDPLTGYDLINEEIASMEITGTILYDEPASGTSKYFRERFF